MGSSCVTKPVRVGLRRHFCSALSRAFLPRVAHLNTKLPGGILNTTSMFGVRHLVVQFGLKQQGRQHCIKSPGGGPPDGPRPRPAALNHTVAGWVSAGVPRENSESCRLQLRLPFCLLLLDR